MYTKVFFNNLHKNKGRELSVLIRSLQIELYINLHARIQSLYIVVIKNSKLFM